MHAIWRVLRSHHLFQELHGRQSAVPRYSGVSKPTLFVLIRHHPKRRYRKIKFFERKKLQRTLVHVTRELENAGFGFVCCLLFSRLLEAES